MAKFLFPIPQWFLSSGVVNAGGLIQTYVAGTVTPQATWSESTGTSLNSNPVVLDSAGRAQIWLSAAAYKFFIQTSAGATIMTIDGYNPDTLNTTVTALTSTGDVTLQQSTAATGSANQSSNNIKIQATYWDGAASQVDQWNIQDVLGAGANPTSALTVTHSGSSGTVSLSVPSAPVSLGSTLAVAGATTQSTSETSPAFISSSANPASAGIVRLASADTIKFRNNANGGDIALKKTGAVASPVPADTLDLTEFGAVESVAFLSNSANQSGTGQIRLASTDSIKWRNNANANDIGLSKTGAVSGSVAADTFNIASFGGLLLAGPIWGVSTIAVDSTHPITIPATTGTMALNPTATLKTGTGGGNYTTSSTTYVRVDSTNLAFTVTVPTGWKLVISASGACFTATAVAQMAIALADGSADNTGILIEVLAVSPVTSAATAWAINYILTGDGASHTINLQFKTSAGADAATIQNNTSTVKPVISFLLTPSN